MSKRMDKKKPAHEKDLIFYIREAGRRADEGALVIDEQFKIIEGLFTGDLQVLEKHPQALKEAVLYRPLYLHEGEWVRDLRIIEFLITMKANVHEVFEGGMTLFILAANGGKTDVVRLLYGHGVDVNAVTHDNCTAYGNVDIARQSNDREELWDFLSGIKGLEKDLHTRYKKCEQNWIGFFKIDPKTLTLEKIIEFVDKQVKDCNLSAEKVLNVRINNQDKFDANIHNTPLHLLAKLLASSEDVSLFYEMFSIGAAMGVSNKEGVTPEGVMRIDKMELLEGVLVGKIRDGTGGVLPEVLDKLVAEYLMPKPSIKEVKKGPGGGKPSRKPKLSAVSSLLFDGVSLSDDVTHD